jgi:hypothetical protein
MPTLTDPAELGVPEGVLDEAELPALLVGVWVTVPVLDEPAELSEPASEADGEAEGSDAEALLEGAAEEVEFEAVVWFADDMAVCWKAANDFSAVGFTAKTIPFWQWFLGLDDVEN